VDDNVYADVDDDVDMMMMMFILMMMLIMMLIMLLMMMMMSMMMLTMVGCVRSGLHRRKFPGRPWRTVDMLKGIFELQ
jgi:hypothetical protein